MRSLIIVFFLLLALTGTVYLMYRTTTLSSRASSSSVAVESDFVNNSYLFASPLGAKANGQETIRVTAFILDNRGIGIPNLLVTLNKPSALNLVAAQDTTDSTGKATFDLTSLIVGQHSVSASINENRLPQELTLNFN